MSKTIRLRKYQEEAVNMVQAEVAFKEKNIIVEMPTGRREISDNFRIM